MENVPQIFLLTICLASTVYSAGLSEIFTWTRIDYDWPHRKAASLISRSPNSGGHNGLVYYVRGLGGGQAGETIIFGGNGPENWYIDSSVAGIPVDYNYVKHPAKVCALKPESSCISNLILVDLTVNNIPMGANVWRNKLFLSVPRRRPGIPSTLNFVPLDSRNRRNVPLIPYPNWNMNLYAPESGYTGNFVSVYRIAIDACDRLWFVDTGIIESASNNTVIKLHELIIIDLHTDQIIGRHLFPNIVIDQKTILTQLTIDTTKDACGDAYAYFPDLSANGLIVFSLRQNRFWRVSHKSFFPEPSATKLSIGGHEFEWKDGIFSIQLSPIKPDGYRDVYYHALAAFHTYRVSSRILRNELLATRSDHGDDFEDIGHKGNNSQTSSADLHKPTGTMFLALVNQNAVGCWNTNDDLNTLSFVHKDDQKMIYPSDLKLFGDNLYVLTNSVPRFIYGKLDYDEINFRVWFNSVDGAVSGTICQHRARRG